MIDRFLIQPTVRLTQKDERAFVHDPRWARVLWWRMVLGLLVVAALTYYMLKHMPSTWTGTIVAMIIAGMLGGRVMNTYRRASAYRDGWVQARFAMLASLRESRLRGMDLDDWVNAEYERDFNNVTF